MIQFKIKTLDGADRDFSVEDETTVAQLKDMIFAQMDIAINNQRLIYAGQVMQNERRLSEFDVNGKVIHLVPRPPQLPQFEDVEFRELFPRPVVHVPRLEMHEVQEIIPAPRLEMREAREEAARAIERIKDDPRTLPVPRPETLFVDPPSELLRDEELARRMNPTTNRLMSVRRTLDDIKSTLSSLLNHTQFGRSGVAARPPVEPMETESSPQTETPQTETRATENPPTQRERRDVGQDYDDYDGDYMYRRNHLPRPPFPARPTLFRPLDMVILIRELENLHTAFEPYRTEFCTILLNNSLSGVSYNERAHRQNTVELACDVMHSMGHAYHALSDISVCLARGFPQIQSDFAAGQAQPGNISVIPMNQQYRENRRAAFAASPGLAAGAARPSTGATGDGVHIIHEYDPNEPNPGRVHVTPLVAAYRAMHTRDAAGARLFASMAAASSGRSNNTTGRNYSQRPHTYVEPITYQIEIETRVPIALPIDTALLNGLAAAANSIQQRYNLLQMQRQGQEQSQGQAQGPRQAQAQTQSPAQPQTRRPVPGETNCPRVLEGNNSNDNAQRSRQASGTGTPDETSTADISPACSTPSSTSAIGDNSNGNEQATAQASSAGSATPDDNSAAHTSSASATPASSSLTGDNSNDNEQGSAQASSAESGTSDNTSTADTSSASTTGKGIDAAVATTGKTTAATGNATAMPAISIKAEASPATSIKVEGAPATSIKAEASPATSFKAEGAPATSIKAEAAPATTVKAKAAPATTVKAGAAPATSIKAEAAPVTTIKAKAAPATTVKARAAPATTVKAGAAPATSIKTEAAPATTVKSEAAPATSVRAEAAPANTEPTTAPYVMTASAGAANFPQASSVLYPAELSRQVIVRVDPNGLTETRHLRHVSTSPTPDTRHTAQRRGYEARRGAGGGSADAFPSVSYSETARLNEANRLEHRAAMVRMAYDRFLQCDSLHASLRLSERRSVYNALDNYETQQRNSHENPITIDHLGQANSAFRPRHVACMMRLLTGNICPEGALHAIFVTLARSLFLEVEQPTDYDALCMPSELPFLRAHLQPPVVRMIQQLMTRETPYSPHLVLSNVAAHMMELYQSFYDRIGDFARIRPGNPMMTKLPMFLRGRMPAIIACIMTESTRDLFLPRFYGVFIRFFKDFCHLFTRYCVINYLDFLSLYTAFIAHLTEDFEPGAREWIRLLATEVLEAIRGEIDVEEHSDEEDLRRSRNLQNMRIRERLGSATRASYNQSPPSFPEMMDSDSDENAPPGPANRPRLRYRFGNSRASIPTPRISSSYPVESRSVATSPGVGEPYNIPPLRDMPSAAPMESSTPREAPTQQPRGSRYDFGLDELNDIFEHSDQARAVSPTPNSSQNSSSRTSPDSMGLLRPTMLAENWDAEMTPVFTRDQRAQRLRSRPQEPLSDAYLTGMSSRKRRCIRAARPPSTLDGLINESIRLADSSMVVETTELRDVVRENVRTYVSSRACDSEDFDPVRYPAANRLLDLTKEDKKESEGEKKPDIVT